MLLIDARDQVGIWAEIQAYCYEFHEEFENVKVHLRCIYTIYTVKCDDPFTIDSLLLTS